MNTINSKKINLFKVYAPYIDDIPEYTKEDLNAYLIDGLPPSGFIEAVLLNDLMLATSRADIVNTKALGQIVKWIVANAPYNSTRSKENVDNWINDKDGCRSRFVDPKLKALMWETMAL